MSMQLRDGSRVCIVGGGPAGSFAAIHLLRLAQARGLRLDVTIFEPRDFSRPGPASCKGCAGILSAGLVSSMDALGLSLPPSVIQAELRAYVVHLAGQAACIEQPAPRRRIISVYRGGGPRLHPGAPLASFDEYLLEQACARGANLLRAPVRSVEWDGGPVVYTAEASQRADLLVLATGVNSKPPLSSAFGYAPPQTAQMSQAEIARPAAWPEGQVAGFMGGASGLVFGAIVPKGRYLNVALLWPGRAADALQQFYHDQARALQFFPADPQNLCGCTARIVVRPARVYFGDRWAAVGDAAVSRLYKDGVNSAFLTAGAAMRAAVERGIARRDFERAYAPLCRRMAADNVYGQMMFDLSARIVRSPFLARAFMDSVRAETGEFSRRVFSRLMWGMLTGDEPYRDLFWLVLRPRALARLARELLRAG